MASFGVKISTLASTLRQHSRSSWVSRPTTVRRASLEKTLTARTKRLPGTCQPVSKTVERLAASFHLLKDGILARISGSGLSVLRPYSCGPVGNPVAARVDSVRGLRQAAPAVSLTGDFLSARPPHQHDDRRAAYLSTADLAESGLICLLHSLYQI